MTFNIAAQNKDEIQFKPYTRSYNGVPSLFYNVFYLNKNLKYV